MRSLPKLSKSMLPYCRLPLLTSDYHRCQNRTRAVLYMLDMSAVLQVWTLPSGHQK